MHHQIAGADFFIPTPTHPNSDQIKLTDHHRLSYGAGNEKQPYHGSLGSSAWWKRKAHRRKSCPQIEAKRKGIWNCLENGLFP